MDKSDSHQIFTAEQVAGMVNHMNEDHADSVLLYVDAYSDTTNAQSAHLLSVDAEGMDIVAQVDGNDTPVRIPFAKRLQTPHDAHMTLVSMSKRARKK